MYIKNWKKINIQNWKYTLYLLPAAIACSKAFLPFESHAESEAPLSSNNFVTATCPSLAASWRGVVFVWKRKGCAWNKNKYFYSGNYYRLNCASTNITYIFSHTQVFLRTQTWIKCYIPYLRDPAVHHSPTASGRSKHVPWQMHNQEASRAMCFLPQPLHRALTAPLRLQDDLQDMLNEVLCWTPHFHQV